MTNPIAPPQRKNPLEKTRQQVFELQTASIDQRVGKKRTGGERFK